MLWLSILYRLVRCLLGVTAVLVRRDLSKDAELLVLRQENVVLRRQISRVRYTRADRAWLDWLRVHLAPLERSGRVEIWHDSKIKTGSAWRLDIESALERYLLISPA